VPAEPALDLTVQGLEDVLQLVENLFQFLGERGWASWV
jgi:hypothetical protein